MKKIFLLALLIISFHFSKAQAPNWLWAEDGLNGSSYEYGYGISTDPSGHVFLSGRCAGTMTFGGKTVTAGGADSPIMGEFDSLGNAIWLQEQTYSGSYDYIFGFGRDNKDNTYGIGTVSSGSAILLEKYNSAGTLRWAKQLSGYGPNGFGVAADNSGSIYITGNLSPGSFTFGTTTVTYSGSYSAILLAKLDSNGNFIWAKCIDGTGGGDGTDDGRDILTDNNGNIYFCGNYTGAPVFGTDTAQASTGYSNFYIAKYDTAGNEEQLITASNASTWATYFGGVFGATHALAMDSCGNYYVTGLFENTAYFDSLSVSSVGGQAIFVAKCSSNGKWQWVSTAVSSSDEHGYAIALDKDNDVYIAGQYLAAANFGGGVNLSGAGLFVAKYANSTGQAVWVQSAGSNSELLLGLAVDNNKFAYITGSIGTTTTFGAINLTPPTNQDIFLAKLDTAPSMSILPVISSGYCPGSTVTIPYTITGNFISGNTFTAQLSDSSGSFIKAISIGSTTSNSNGTITITIPVNTPPGSNYLIRIVSSNPAYCSYVGCFGFSIGSNLSTSVFPAADTICSGGSVLLTASGGTGASYMWSNGAATDTTTVNPTIDTTYIVTVSSGGCSANDTVNITVNPVAPLTIQPPSPAMDCNGQPITLSVPVSGINYIWSPSTYLNQTTGDTVIATPVNNITYTVSGVDSLGCNVSGTEEIIVSSGPSKPTITHQDSVLISSSTQSNQWLRNDTIIKGATNQDYVVTTSGYYQVVVSNPANGCSTTSDSIFVSGINQLSALNNQLSIYPNPTNGVIIVNISSSAGEVKNWNLQITDVLGRTVYTKSTLNYTNEIDISKLPSGMYFITVINKTGRAVVPVVKQN